MTFHPTLCAAALAALLAAPVGAAVDPGFSNAGALRWLCGGVGADERRALAAAGTEANLEILFVGIQRGEYVAGAELAVFAPGTADPLLLVPAAGPVCFIDAPAGTYRLKARLDGIEREKLVHVGRPGHAVARAVLAFPDEAWDAGPVSAEEKRQAATR